MSEPTQATHDRWQEFQSNVELYKFYLDLTVKVAGLVFTLAGAILAYILAHYQDNGVVLQALALPIGLSLALLGLHLKGAKKAEEFVQKHKNLSDMLDTATTYDFSFLKHLQHVVVGLYGLLGVGLSLLWIFVR